MEAHREAFHNRIEFIDLQQKHDGTEKFPYNEFDLAKYLMHLNEITEEDQLSFGNKG